MRGLLQGKINDLVGERGEESNELYVIGREEMDYRADVEP